MVELPSRKILLQPLPKASIQFKLSCNFQILSIYIITVCINSKHKMETEPMQDEPHNFTNETMQKQSVTWLVLYVFMQQSV